MNKQMVLSVGMPRAGSGWYYNLTKDLVVASGGLNAKEIRTKYPLKRLLTEVNCNLGTLSFYRLIPVLLPLVIERPYVIKLHAERRPLADLLITLGVIKSTYIFRDPRDALLSAYEYGQRMSEKRLENAFTPLTTIEKSINFMASYVKIARGWLSSEHTLAVKYEDFKSNYDHEVSKLIAFLEIDPTENKIKEIIGSYRPEQKGQNRQGLHFVKGKVGRYKDSFTDSQIDQCDRLFGDFLQEYGYSE
ncbi:MAG: sulfotransferase domain-containing protein [Anaerolineales bacterium]|nr:sulfotransferase domain-containing protein [Anaerolineales bacterium]